MTEQIRVDIVSDVVCPWCVIGHHQLARAAEMQAQRVAVHWHPFELNPQMGAEGENLRAHLAAKYGTTHAESLRARAHLTEIGADLGFVFDYADDMRMVNTFRVHQLIDLAEMQGRAHDMALALFAAFFTRRADLNDVAVLTEIAAEIGLEGAAARTALEQGTQAGLVRQKQQVWTARGITGVPAMIFARQHLVTGAQGVDTYRRILAHLAQVPAAT